MPRRPGRPFPSLTDLASEPEPEVFNYDRDRLTIMFFLAMMWGLLARLRRMRPSEKWLQERLNDLGSRFLWIAKAHGIDLAFTAIVREVATAHGPRRNTPPCDPLLLLSHYEEARRLLERKKLIHLRRWKNQGAMRIAAREAARELYKKLTAPPPCRNIPSLGKSVQLPDLLRCTCARRTTLPPDLDTRILKPWTQRDLILHLLAHHHALTRDSLHRLLDEGARLLAQTRQEAVKPRFPQSTRPA